jgi:hypothetical protein
MALPASVVGWPRGMPSSLRLIKLIFYKESYFSSTVAMMMTMQTTELERDLLFAFWDTLIVKLFNWIITEDILATLAGFISG